MSMPNVCAGLRLAMRSVYGQLAGILLCCLPAVVSHAQSACAACLTRLPDSLAADTIYLGEAMTGRVGEFYEGDISFRIPRTTTPVAATDSTTPPGITIQRITVNSLANVPPGLNWTVSQTVFNLPGETDGCVRFCGTPLQAGLYEVEVVVTARVFIFDQTTSFTFPLLIEPARSVTEGFTLLNNVACGETEVTFINNVPSEGREGFSYRWDFGNGNNSLAEAPPPQNYRRAGIYPVHYQAIVDTAGYFLTNVRIEAVTCSDFFGAAPDLQLKVFSPEGKELYRSDVLDDKFPPVDFNLNLRLGPGNYSVQVVDDDGVLVGGDKNCGTFNFSRSTTGELTNAGSKARLTILHPVDTIQSQDTVLIFEQPLPPAISALTPAPYCAGDTVRLGVQYNNRLQWFRDSLPLEGGQSQMLDITSAGRYSATYTSPNGCQASAAPLTVTFNELPLPPIFDLERNLLTLADTLILPRDYRFDWLLNDSPLQRGTTEASFCIRSSGIYTLVLTDESTGCSRSYSMSAVYDPKFPGCISDVDPFEELVGGVRIFPNPASAYVNLELELLRSAPVGWRLLNTQGQWLQQGEEQALPGLNSWRIEMENLPAGLYWLQVRANGEERGFRIVRIL